MIAWPGCQFLHFFQRHIEGRHNSRALRCGYNHFIILIPECRANAIGIAQHKGVAIANKAAAYIAAIKVRGGLLEHAFYIELRRVRVVGKAEVVVHHLYHSAEVALAHGSGGVLIQDAEQLVGIDEVEVARHRQVARGDDIGLEEGVAELHIVAALRAVAQVAQQHLAHKAHIAFEQARMIADVRVHLFQLRHFAAQILEDGGDGACPAHAAGGT